VLEIVVLKLAVATIVVEAVTEVFVDSALFESFRKWIGGEREEGLARKYGLKGVLVWCGYCVSVSIGIGTAYLLWIDGIHHLDPRLARLAPFEPALWGLVVHRLSNLWHETVLRYLKQIPFSLFLRVWKQEDKDK
jgi:hypothetical protein